MSIKGLLSLETASLCLRAAGVILSQNRYNSHEVKGAANVRNVFAPCHWTARFNGYTFVISRREVTDQKKTMECAIVGEKWRLSKLIKTCEE